MFFADDCSLLLEPNLRPEALGNERPRQPVHGKAEVVQFPQVDIGADRARFKTGKQLLGLRLQNDPMTKKVKSLVLGGTLPAVLR